MKFCTGMTRFGSVAMTLAAGSALFAQVSTGTLTGAVKDANGAPLAGVQVILSSPALFAPRTLTTGAKGEWRVAMLPVGNYRIVANRTGFISAGVDNVRVGLGSAGRQDLILKAVTTATATVEVVANSEIQDKSDTKTATNFSAEQMAVLPGIDRSFTGAADMAPGVATGANGQFTVRGGSTQDTLYRVNGVDVKDDYQGAQVGRVVIEDNIEDIQVITSPLNARNGRALGGQVNVVTKSGGNDFAGSIRSTLSRPSWGAAGRGTQGAVNETNDTLNREFQVTLSGPIVKDRLWFSLGTNLSPKNSNVYSLGTAGPSAKWIERSGIAGIDSQLQTPPSGYALTLFDENKFYNKTQDESYYEGKLTGAITQDHTLEFSMSSDKVTTNNRDPYGDSTSGFNYTVRRLAMLGTQESKKTSWSANYRGILSSTTFLDAKYARFESTTTFPTGDPTRNKQVSIWMDTDQTPYNTANHNWTNVGYPFGFGISTTPDTRNHTNASANLKMYRELAGSHEIDLGMEYYQSDRGTSREQGPGNATFRAGGAVYNPTTDDYLFPSIIWMGKGINGQSGSGNSGLAPMMIQYAGHDGITKNTTTSGYANDQWTINKNWNVMMGLRWDHMSIQDTDGATLTTSSDFSPRLQVVFDAFGDNKHILTATAARYGGDFYTGFTDAFIKKADSSYVQYGFSGIAGQPAPGTATDPALGLRWLTYAQLTDPANYGQAVAGVNNAFSYGDASKSYVMQGKLKAPHVDELTLTYRRNFNDGSFVRLTYVNRDYKANWAFKQDYDPANWIQIANPVTHLNPAWVQKTYVFNSDDLTRRYHALEMEWLKRVNSIWTISGNYTYSRLIGNNNGGDSTSSFRDNGVPGYYGNSAWLTGTNGTYTGLGLSTNDFAPTGPLLMDQTHRARVAATAVVPVGKGQVSFSWLLRYDSGNNWSLTDYKNTGLANLTATGAPYAGGKYQGVGIPAYPTTYAQFYSDRGAYTYNDTYQVDFKLNWMIPLGFKRLQLIGDVSVNNLFNTQLQGTYNITTAANGSGNLNMMLNPSQMTADNKIANFWNYGRSVGTSLGLKF